MLPASADGQHHLIDTQILQFSRERVRVLRFAAEDELRFVLVGDDHIHQLQYN